MTSSMMNSKTDQNRWKHSPKGSSWGEFGPNDERGRMNLVTKEKVLQGVAEVREGLTFCLSLPLDYPGGQVLNPRRQPPQRFGTPRDGAQKGTQGFCWSWAAASPEATDVICDDILVMNLQYSTQWDSFAHVGSQFDADGDGVAEQVFYNGFKAGSDIVAGLKDAAPAVPWMEFPNPSANKLSIANLAEHGAQGRAVMIDLEAHVGRKKVAVGYDQLMRILDADKVVVERGDMVCVNTGFADTLLKMHRQPDVEYLAATGSGLDGWDDKLLNWITDSGLACLIADNLAVELMHSEWPGLFETSDKYPATDERRIRRPKLPLHEHCLFKHGIHLGELWYLTDLATWLRKNKRSRFLLTAPPLRLPGAVGSPATPIATV
jgi:kynurenine formamidase